MDDIVVGEIVPCSDESLYELPIATEIPGLQPEVQYVNWEPIPLPNRWELVQQPNDNYRRIYIDRSPHIRKCVMYGMRMIYVMILLIAVLILLFRD